MKQVFKRLGISLSVLLAVLLFQAHSFMPHHHHEHEKFDTHQHDHNNGKTDHNDFPGSNTGHNAEFGITGVAQKDYLAVNLHWDDESMDIQPGFMVTIPPESPSPIPGSPQKISYTPVPHYVAIPLRAPPSCS